MTARQAGGEKRARRTEPSAAPQPLTDDDALRLLRPVFSSADIVVLAVSGGGDSTALMHLATRAAPAFTAAHNGSGVRLRVATVDHGLRAASSAEAAKVAQAAATLGLPHAVLTWSGAKPKTGLQAAARAMRHALLNEHANKLAEVAAAETGETRRPRVVPRVVIATAHHLEDQAETLLMRLARGTGPAGLAGIRPTTTLHGHRWVRPLLSVPKARLLATLEAEGITWVEDPTNADPHFERARLRAMQPALLEAGLTAPALALVARRQREAHEALRHAIDQALDADLRQHGVGTMSALDLERWRARPTAIRYGMIGRLLRAHGGGHPPADLAQCEALGADIAAFVDASAVAPETARAPSLPPLSAPLARTLGGCQFRVHEGLLQVFRELGRGLPALAVTEGQAIAWDKRFGFRVSTNGLPNEQSALRIGALGPAGRVQIETFRALDRSSLRPIAEGLPALWHGDEIVAHWWPSDEGDSYFLHQFKRITAKSWCLAPALRLDRQATDAPR
ncbi:MAG: tRNA lysidine(34) synthetase TilS [Pseudomonadota bacterium]